MNWRPAGKKLQNSKVHARAAAPASRLRPRLGWLWLLSKFALGAAVVLGAASAIAFGAHRFLISSSRFALEQVEATGTRRFTEDELLALAGTRRGANLFALDIAGLERTLTQNPWIAEAHIARRLPNTLNIAVTELEPAAMAVLDGSLYLITRQGRPIKAVEAQDPIDLPTITGLSSNDFTVDRARATELLEQAFSVHREYDRLPLSKTYPTEEIHLGADGKIDLVVGQKGMTFQLGKAPYRAKLLMAGRVVAQLRTRGQTPAVVFLDNEAHPERVVVRMR